MAHFILVLLSIYFECDCFVIIWQFCCPHFCLMIYYYNFPHIKNYGSSRRGAVVNKSD